MFLSGVFVALRVPPVIPFIQLPGEKFPEGYNIPFTDIRVTNTFVAGVIVWIILLLLAAYVARRRPKDGNEVPPGGFYNMFEMLFEGLMGFVGGIAGGRHFRLIFNMFMTIFLLVLVANWMELIPGIDTIGFIHPHTKEKYDADTGEYKVITTDGYEIYPSIIGYAVNGQCDWISPADEAAADQAALVAAEAARLATLDELAVDAAYQRYQEAHGDHGDEADASDDSADHGDDDHADETDQTIETNEADAAYNEVLAAREAEKQARADRQCYTGVGPVPWSDDYVDDYSKKTKDIPAASRPWQRRCKTGALGRAAIRARRLD